MSSIRSGMRPMSAKAPSHQRQLIARTFNDKSNTNSVDNVAKIWTAFGKYVAKSLKAGKGVGIPKFGNFTFTPIHVDLYGTTNPNERDKQIREPIFQIAKDFVLGMPIVAGVVHDNGAIRPFEIRGTSGIVPKVKINYTEIGYFAGVNKEDAKHGCDIVVRDLSDKIKSGQSTQLLIPNVGTFMCKGKIAGIKFNSDLVEQSKGTTSKQHFVGKLFASNVFRELTHDTPEGEGRNALRIASNFLNTDQRKPVVAKHDHGITVSHGAESWLKNNFGVSIDNGDLNEYTKSRPKMKRTYSARPGFRSVHSDNASSVYSGKVPSSVNKQTLDQLPQHVDPVFKIRSTTKNRRPMSAYSGGSRKSRASSMRSAASHVPTLTRANALMYCNKIATKAVLDYVKTTKHSARDKLSPSEIQNILQNSGVHMDIATVRGFLNHLSFPAHGKSCSILDLIRTCKQWNGTGTASQALTVGTLQPSIPTAPVEELVAKIRDCFYKTGRTIKQIFDAGCDNEAKVDEEAFVFLCKKYCYPTISEEESRYVFQACFRNLRTDLYASDFRNIFGSVLPKHNFHIQGLKVIRDWMYKNGLTSEQAYDALAGSKKSMDLNFFEGAMKKLFDMTSPEIEAVFVAVDENVDGLIDKKEWCAKVYEDAANPLQLLREIVNEHNLSSDDLLFRMKLRIWDDPLDFPKFAQALRILDSSLTDVQLRAMAKSMKTSKNLVEVPTLMRNLVGKDFETVDFRDKLFKRLYNEILEMKNGDKKEQFKNLLIKYDDLNDGSIVAQDLQTVLNGICKDVSSDDIERFTRFLEKDARGRIDYTQFIADLEKVKDYNPFKNLVSRIKAFMTQNNQNLDGFMKRLVIGQSQSGYGDTHEEGFDKERKVSVEFFAKFLKNKVDKKRDSGELMKYAQLIDVDNDGYISIYDLQACLGNLNNETFFKDNGATLVGTFKTILTEREKFFPKESLPDAKALEVISKIKDALLTKGISFRELFARLDSNNDEFLTYAEFADNIDAIVKLSPIIKEQFFACMDENKIGMVDYESFLSVMKRTPVTAKLVKVQDNFNWEDEMVQKMKQWIKDEDITADQAFKAFDRDFDGLIDLADLKWILTNVIKVGDKSTINTCQLERLFKLLDFHKSGNIQKCDIQRLVENENPYLSTGKLSNAKFMVGGDTFDWKNNAIQQIGIELSKNPNYSSLADCFKAASHSLSKVRYRDFKEFMEETHALKGFNLTDQLLQQLFSELDPHKKGFLSETDWMAAFGGFNWHEQMIVEVENLIASSFTDIESAIEYFQVIGKSKSITYPSFEIAINSLRGMKLKDKEMKYLWSHFADNKSVLSADRFKHVLSSINFSGTSTLRKTGKSMKTTTFMNKDATLSKREQEIMEKFRKIIRSSDLNADGQPAALELNLSQREIDEIIKVVSKNMDGSMGWQEYLTKFKVNRNEQLIQTRAKNKMAKLKEQMTLHMKSPQDAFDLFDQNKNGRLTFSNFNDLIKELAKLSAEVEPPYGIIKDMFEEINTHKDGEIDLKEWNTMFVNVQSGDKKFCLKALPQELAEFEVSRDAKIVMDAIKRNRKFLNEKFAQVSQDGNFVSFEDAKEIIRAVQRGKDIDDGQYRVLFKGALRDDNMVEYKRLGRDLKAKFT